MQYIHCEMWACECITGFCTVLTVCLCAGRKRQPAAAAEEEQRGNTDFLPLIQLELLFTCQNSVSPSVTFSAQTVATAVVE